MVDVSDAGYIAYVTICGTIRTWWSSDAKLVIITYVIEALYYAKISAVWATLACVFPRHSYGNC